VLLAQFALPKWPALGVGVSGEHGCAGAAAADGVLCRISAREQLNLGGHGKVSAAASRSSRQHQPGTLVGEMADLAFHAGRAAL
jgi:hypothetical protein